MNKNIFFRKFKLELLESCSKMDEMDVYRIFLFDFGNKNSKIGNGLDAETEVVVVNWRWCENMLKYF